MLHVSLIHHIICTLVAEYWLGIDIIPAHMPFAYHIIVERSFFLALQAHQESCKGMGV